LHSWANTANVVVDLVSKLVQPASISIDLLPHKRIAVVEEQPLPYCRKEVPILTDLKQTGR